MTFHKNMDLKHLGLRSRRKRSAWWITPVILLIVFGYGLLEKRDREHQDEVNALLKIIGHQSMKMQSAADIECLPVIEMDMPVQRSSL